MEYLNKLSSLVATPAKSKTVTRRRKASAPPTVGTLPVFHRNWDAIKSTLQRPDERALFFGIERTNVPQRLQRLVDVLVFESNRYNDVAGSCMEYTLKHGLLDELVTLSQEDKPTGIKGQVIQTFTNLIILLDEKFLSRQAVHRPISNLIQACIASGQDETEDEHDSPTKEAQVEYHEDLVDLMCHIASRIRNTPDLLLIFFSDHPANEQGDSFGSVVVEGNNAAPVIEVRPPSPAESVDSTATLQPNKSQDTTKRQRRLGFPLFSYLLRFVHREGRTGELARAGLLFLITLQVTPAESTKVRCVTSEPEPLDNLRNSLATFVAHSDFADVLGAGLGAAYGLLPTRIKMVRPINSSDLPAFASTSEPDTPSDPATPSDSAEVQAQLRLLVDLLEFAQDVLDSITIHGQSDMFSHLVTSVCRAIRDMFIKNVLYPSLLESSGFDGSATAVMGYLDAILLVLREGHLLTEVVLQYLLGFEATLDTDDKFVYPGAAEDRYSLKDLIIDNMASERKTHAKVAAIKLAQTLVVRHERYAVGGLLEAIPLNKDGTLSEVMIAQHTKETDAYASLLSSAGLESMHTGFSSYLLDAEQSIWYHSTVQQSRLSPNDPFFRQLCESLSGLFAQAPEINLSLSGVIAALASSPSRSLKGWLTYDGDAQPTILEILKGLYVQVQSYRKRVEGFDAYLAERRKGLVLSEDLEDALDGEGGEEEGKLVPSLSLPRARKKKNVETDERLGLVEDRRSEIVEEQQPPSQPQEVETKPSTLARLFGGRPVKQVVALPEPQHTITASPYAKHYAETTLVFLQAISPSGHLTKVTLSSVLDNTLLLDEMVKELLSILQVRRGWGMDLIVFH